MDPLQIYNTYHGLWKIEESFRITKSYLDARPVYLQKKETIYGHFLICCLGLFLLRVLEIKIFKNRINSYDLIHFMRDFRIVSKGDGTYINISRNQAVKEKAREVTGLANLDALFLSEKEIENLFHNCILLEKRMKNRKQCTDTVKCCYHLTIKAGITLYYQQSRLLS